MRRLTSGTAIHYCYLLIYKSKITIIDYCSVDDVVEEFMKDTEDMQVNITVT